MPTSFKSFLLKIAQLLYPSKCILCGTLGEGAVCCECDALLQKAKPYPFGVRTFGKELSCYYIYDYNDENVKKMLLYAKSHNNKMLFEYLAKQIESVFLEEYENGKYTPCHIPRRPSAKLKYGHDQARCVLELLCREKGVEYSPLLSRRFFSREQKTLDKKMREKNMKKSLYTKTKIPRRVILYDDIITSGTSAVSAYKVLRKKGARDIKFIFLASKSYN